MGHARRTEKKDLCNSGWQGGSQIRSKNKVGFIEKEREGGRKKGREKERKESGAEASRASGIVGIMESSTCGPISRVRDVMWCSAIRHTDGGSGR